MRIRIQGELRVSIERPLRGSHAIAITSSASCILNDSLACRRSIKSYSLQITLADKIRLKSHTKPLEKIPRQRFHGLARELLQCVDVI